MKESKITFYSKYIKRPIDLVLALLALILLSPLFIVVGLLVYFKLGSPVIFKQERPGYKGNIFTLYKFRTMTDEKDSHGQLLSNRDRLTHLGKKLRSSSLDELPELINVIKGDMSFVGPRPLLKEYLPLYSKEQMRRHEVRPGLTGLAQIMGRNEIEWDKKFQYDLDYLDQISFKNDIKILLQTVGIVFKKEGVNYINNAYTDKFKGNKDE